MKTQNKLSLSQERVPYTVTLLHSWLLATLWLAGIWDFVLSLTDHLHETCHSQVFVVAVFIMQERSNFSAHFNSVMHMCAHTYTQSVPINTFHRAFHTKLIMRNRCHYQHRQGTTALTALQTALRRRNWEMNDRTAFVDDHAILFIPPPVCVFMTPYTALSLFSESCP